MSKFVGVATKTCFVCKKADVLKVSAYSYYAWKNGAFVQDAFPELSPAEREQLITGTHGACWDAYFGNEDDE